MLATFAALRRSLAIIFRYGVRNRAILAELQADDRLTVSELADRVRLTPGPCHRRLRELERSGVITGYRALVAPRRRRDGIRGPRADHPGTRRRRHRHRLRSRRGESLGWLFVDAAGQAPPQYAVGALWRARRAVIVGDPLQLKPVVTLPQGGQQALLREFGVGEQWAACRTSVRQVACVIGNRDTWGNGVLQCPGCPHPHRLPTRHRLISAAITILPMTRGLTGWLSLEMCDYSVYRCYTLIALTPGSSPKRALASRLRIIRPVSAA